MGKLLSLIIDSVMRNSLKVITKVIILAIILQYLAKSKKQIIFFVE